MPAELLAWQDSLELFAPEFRTMLVQLATQLSSLLFPVEAEAEEGEQSFLISILTQHHIMSSIVLWHKGIKPSGTSS